MDVVSELRRWEWVHLWGELCWDGVLGGRSIRWKGWVEEEKRVD